MYMLSFLLYIVNEIVAITRSQLKKYLQCVMYLLQLIEHAVRSSYSTSGRNFVLLFLAPSFSTKSTKYEVL